MLDFNNMPEILETRLDAKKLLEELYTFSNTTGLRFVIVFYKGPLINKAEYRLVFSHQLADIDKMKAEWERFYTIHGIPYACYTWQGFESSNQKDIW